MATNDNDSTVQQVFDQLVASAVLVNKLQLTPEQQAVFDAFVKSTAEAVSVIVFERNALRADVDAANARAQAAERVCITLADLRKRYLEYVERCKQDGTPRREMDDFTEWINFCGIDPDEFMSICEEAEALTATAQPADGSAAELDSVFGVPVEPSDTEGTGRIVKLNEPKWTRPLRSDDLTDE